MLIVRPRLPPKQGDPPPNFTALIVLARPSVENLILLKFGLPLDEFPLLRSRRRYRYNSLVPVALRDFQPSDFDLLWSIDQECFPPGISYSRSELKTYMRRRGSFTLVAVGPANDGNSNRQMRQEDVKKSLPQVSRNRSSISGFIVAEAGNGVGHVITIDVVASARRFGVGSLLLGGAEDRLRAAGCRTVELETAVDNASAIAFYKRHGYSVVETFPRYYSNGVDALVLEKVLQKAEQRGSTAGASLQK